MKDPTASSSSQGGTFDDAPDDERKATPRLEGLPPNFPLLPAFLQTDGANIVPMDDLIPDISPMQLGSIRTTNEMSFDPSSLTDSNKLNNTKSKRSTRLPLPPEGFAIAEPDANPKSLFHEHFQSIGMELSRCDCFFSWKRGEAHTLEFASALVLPTTGEVFVSGHLYNVEGKEQPINDLPLRGPSNYLPAWYRTKKLAERAAAGRAMDCLRLREGEERKNGGIIIVFGANPPYPSPQVENLGLVPDCVPLSVKQEISKCQEKCIFTGLV